MLRSRTELSWKHAWRAANVQPDRLLTKSLAIALRSCDMSGAFWVCNPSSWQICRVRVNMVVSRKLAIWPRLPGATTACQQSADFVQKRDDLCGSWVWQCM